MDYFYLITLSKKIYCTDGKKYDGICVKSKHEVYPVRHDIGDYLYIDGKIRLEPSIVMSIMAVKDNSSMGNDIFQVEDQ
jgi:hypothetical protein